MTESKNVLDWIKYANKDLEVAKYLMTMNSPVYEHICYCCQQSAGKYIKAVTLKLGDEITKVHDLVRLRLLIGRKVDTSAIIDSCAILTSYATVTRYPCNFIVDEEEAKIAINEAQKVKVWADKVIGC